MAKQGVFMLPPALNKESALNLMQLVAKVNLSIGEMRSEFQHSIVSSELLRMFSLNESVLSTRIEGTQVTFTDMIEHDKKRQPSWEQQEVLNYVEALDVGAKKIAVGDPITTRFIKSLHAILMQNARGTTASEGNFRKIQNFIGPDSDIRHAVYIPVSAADIDSYMENLEFFINGQRHSSFKNYPLEDNSFVLDEQTEPILKIAIMHAQFESIHPFLDGNGRMGRILIALLAVKLGLVNLPVFLVSEELEKERARYYDLLNGIRGKSPDWYSWLHFFVTASGRMAKRLLEKMHNANDLANVGLKKCKLESERRIWQHSFKQPVMTAPQVAQDLGIAPGTARKSLNSLSKMKLLYAEEGKRRNKKYRNYDLIRILA